MKKIKRYVDMINEELNGAKEYAFEYLEKKADNETENASRYKEMATDELKHSIFLHDMALSEIDNIKRVYEAPAEMQEEWKYNHKRYVESVANIKQLLAL